MKKAMKNILFRLGGVMCAIAAFIAVNGINITCDGKYYQPEMPKGVENFEK